MGQLYKTTVQIIEKKIQLEAGRIVTCATKLVEIDKLVKSLDSWNSPRNWNLYTV